MSGKYKWVIVEGHSGWRICWYLAEDRICWYLAEDDELGMYFGSGLEGYVYAAPGGDDSWERGHNFAVDELKRLGLGERARGGFIFETLAQAKQALRVLQGCMKRALDETPWPEWAAKAQAAGWKPPKGWKPA